MQLISSPRSGKVKFIFKYLWLVNLLMILAIGIHAKIKHEVIGTPLIVAFFVVPIVGYIMGNLLLRHVVDEIWETEEGLLIKNNLEEGFISWGEVLKMTYSIYSEIPRINLKLRSSSAFGDTISFFPFGNSLRAKKILLKR
jgi:hypothetical protein